MPVRPDISSVLVIGSGSIVIRQACEFDYSGAQACRVLRAEGIRVILVSSDPATIVTDLDVADTTCIELITPEVLTTIIVKERPDALLPTLGGQTVLNVAMSLVERSVLDEYDVEFIGASTAAINAGEDRDEFKDIVERCGTEVARSIIAYTMDECRARVDTLDGYPVVVRPSFTMDGLDSGVAFNDSDLHRIAGTGLAASRTTEILLEESILGWKECEFELMRDTAGGVVVVCSTENVDPAEVHTGNSITVAPALTPTDRELQRLRDIGITVVREVGAGIDGCNIQFTVDPATGRIIVIEISPHVSRSSVLISKTTGFPIAKITARLAVGYTLDKIPNDITGSTPASFRPTPGYVVAKVPHFAFEKFRDADPRFTTIMKSASEAMAIGRSYTEALQKALRSLDEKGTVFHQDGPAPSQQQTAELLGSITVPAEHRLVGLQQAVRSGATITQLHGATRIDLWLLDQILLLKEVAQEVKDTPALTIDVLALAKRHGLSGIQIVSLRGIDEDTMREVHHAFGLRPVYRTADTYAVEFASRTPYLYSSYDLKTEVASRGREVVIILDSGPNRIGQGVGLDYSCVHATMALSDCYETVTISCNPETVSTGYNISDRFYFEPLTLEDAIEIYEAELTVGPVAGVIVQLGGQTPLSLATRLAKAGVPTPGTSPEAVGATENREAFGAVLQCAGLPAPAHGTALSDEQARSVAQGIGYPVLMRPSCVLGGRGMEIVYDAQGLDDYLQRTGLESGGACGTGPLLIGRFLDNAIEIGVDALYDGSELFLGGIMEYIEETGIHFGGSAYVMPPMTLPDAEITRIRRSTEAIAKDVDVQGLLNTRFALVSDVLYVIEANPRASCTVPFISKASGVRLAKAAALIMTGGTIASLRRSDRLPGADATVTNPDDPIAVKEAVLPFKRFRTTGGRVVDTILGPEVRSTGEVMSYDVDFPRTFAKSQVGAYGGLPGEGTLSVPMADRNKRTIVLPVARPTELGFTTLATTGTTQVLRRSGTDTLAVRKISQGAGDHGEQTIAELIEFGAIDIVVNTPKGQGTCAGSYSIRAATTGADRPIITTVQQLQAAVQAPKAQPRGPFRVRSLQEHVTARRPRRGSAFESRPVAPIDDKKAG